MAKFPGIKSNKKDGKDETDSDLHMNWFNKSFIVK